ncbi:MAG: protoglobin domain-containing protein [Phycisphaerae bacterium]|nr:protoglobin domain-containing protein [Phycisphaerae bacterium]
MSSELFDEIKRYVRFTDADAALLKSLGARLRPVFPEIVTEFYDRIVEHSHARAVLTDGHVQIDRLRVSLRGWLESLFGGAYDEPYYNSRAAIGRMHVRVRLPQHFMVTAMNVIRMRMLDHVESLPSSERRDARRAIEKILDIDLSIMLDTYREHVLDQLREAERERFEQRLIESKHLATIGQLAASLAHEIKNPLAGISGALQVIREGMEPEHAYHEVLAEALRQIDRLDEAVKDLLVFARPKPPTRERQSISALLQRSMLLIREETSVRGLKLQIEEAAQDVWAEVDEGQMQQVLANVLINALHACGPDGEIVCRLSENGDTIRLEVEDNGCGMNREVSERAFEPFFTTKARGTGLGLAICRRIVEAHDGRIWIEPRSPRGTRVVIELARTQ